MTKKLFSIPILNAMSHNEETEKILAPLAKERKQSAFIRQAIITIAKEYGFNFNDNNDIKPHHVPGEVWHDVMDLRRKNVDYSYVSAFYWLKSLPEFESYNRSELMRKIICSYHNGT